MHMANIANIKLSTQVQHPSVRRVLQDPYLVGEICKRMRLPHLLTVRQVCVSFRDGTEHIPTDVTKRCAMFVVAGTAPTMHAALQWHRILAEHRNYYPANTYCNALHRRLMAPTIPGAKISARNSITITERNPIVADMGLLHSAEMRIMAPARNLAILGSIHTLKLSYSPMLTDVSMLGGVHTLDLAGCHLVTDVSMLGNVHSLNLAYCVGVTDASALGGVHTLMLTSSSVQIPSCDANPLWDAVQWRHNRRILPTHTGLMAKPGAHKWSFGGNNRLVSANFARGVVDVDLTHCYNITDVSALADSQTVKLSFCSLVADVSTLGRLRDLCLLQCYRVTDVSMLGGLRRLNLSGCTGVTDVSALGGLYSLSLYGCTGVTDVSMLGAVHILDLSKCTGLTDISAVAHIAGLIRPTADAMTH